MGYPLTGRDEVANHLCVFFLQIHNLSLIPRETPNKLKIIPQNLIFLDQYQDQGYERQRNCHRLEETKEPGMVDWILEQK